MANPSKPRPASPAKRPGKTAPKAAGTAGAPFIRVQHSEALHRKTMSVIASLEKAPDATAHRDSLADVVVELTSSGLDYCFMKPLKASKAGFLVQQSANLGLAGAQQVMGSVIRNIIGRMDGPQLLSVCGSIRQLMV